MEAWHDELQRLDERVQRAARERAARRRSRTRRRAGARRGPRRSRAAAEAQRTELLRLVSTQREQRPAASQRDGGRRGTPAQRAGASPARRARGERRRSVRQRASRPIASRRANERAQLEEQLVAARATLAQRQQEEDETRQNVARCARRARRRGAPPARSCRIARDASRSIASAPARERRARRSASSSSPLEAGAARRRAQLDRARARERRHRGRRSAYARGRGSRRARRATRAVDRETRDREAAARAELFRADEAHTSLQGKVNALDALERERVGLAPAAARLLREREQFGEGGVLGPLSDFISADQASALLVERFLGATVHAVLVRDRAVAEAVRVVARDGEPRPAASASARRAARRSEWRTTTAPMRCRIASTPPARARRWVRALLGHAQPVDDGAAFVDARGAVWLPGSTAGPGPLRRRAELFALRAELTATEQARAGGDGRGRHAARRGAGIRAPRARGVGGARSGAGRRATRRGTAG